MDFLNKFFVAFIPLFFAFDAIGILPVFLSMTGQVYIDKRRKIVNQATLTAFLVSFGFIYLGQWIFKFLGITISDFRIAGGILLLVFSVVDLLFSEANQRRATKNGGETIGVVPIGMPLIVGPAVLTTLLLNVSTNGYTATTLALIANIVIVWIVFYFSDRVIKVTGEAGATAVGKVFALLLAAIAVMMIRVGVHDIITIVNKF